MPPLAYALLGNCRQLVVGPTGIMGLMVSALAATDTNYAVLLAFLNGMAIILCAVLRLGPWNHKVFFFRPEHFLL